MTRIILGLILCVFSLNVSADEVYQRCENMLPGLKDMCNRWNALWHEGNTDLYLTAYAWHNRYTYSAEKVKSFNENAWGGGVGKGMYDKYGNWHGIYAVAFMDSHNHVEPLAGYMWLKMFYPTENIKIGAGLSVFLTSRVDIFNSIPFPGALPWVSLGYKNVTLNATYIPGSKGAGNVLFIGGRYTFPNV